MSDLAPSRTAIIDALRSFVLEHFPAARRIDLPADAPLLDSGIVDSLGILELVNFVTETFEITVSDEDLQPENFHSIDRLASFVERRRA